MNTSELEIEIKKLIEGDTESSTESLDKYSKDASIFKITPTLVVYPKNSNDVKQVVKFVARNKPAHPELSITARSAGTCMSGGAINDSIIMDFTKYMNEIIDFKEESVMHYGFKMTGSVTAMPGVYYRDFEEFTLGKGMLMPTYTASREICAIGGMVANNSGGEKTIKYGKVENFIKSLKIVLRDGNEYEVKPLAKKQLEVKCVGDSMESELYKDIYKLITENLNDINEAKPKVSKNSAGYYLWNILGTNEKGEEVFDLCRLIVGSQGTLGIITEITWYLVPQEKYKMMHVSFLKNTDKIGEIVNEILPLGPESVESYDDYSLTLAIKFFPDFIRQMNIFEFIKMGISFIPEAFMMLRGGLPKLVVITEFSESSIEACKDKVNKLDQVLKNSDKDFVNNSGLQTRITNSHEGEKYWRIRHESFNLLRKHVKGKHTAPFIDDICVSPYDLPEFLPRLNAILKEYKLVYTIAGHAGNGNFHIIPLMDFKDVKTRDIIMELSEKVYDLVHEYKGTITAEHNDGLVRTPYLDKMFSSNILSLFKKTKEIFDPLNIFNPRKKVGADKTYMYDHIDLEKPTQKYNL
jgi:FAD/FMN-containing dehydrogenase